MALILFSYYPILLSINIYVSKVAKKNVMMTLDSNKIATKIKTWQRVTLALEVKMGASGQYNKGGLSHTKAQIYNMDKIYAALQQNRGNIWSQYFPHCLPSPHIPSLFTLYVLRSHTIPCISLPAGSPEPPFGCQQREIWFPVYKEDSQKRKWEQFSVRKQYMASVSPCPLWMSYMCR